MKAKSQHINLFSPFSWSGIQEMKDQMQNAIDSGVYDQLKDAANYGNPFSSNYNPEYYTDENFDPEKNNSEPETEIKTNNNTTYIMIGIMAVVLIAIILIKKSK